MRTNNNATAFFRRFWPNSHRRYEEICVLAATGQLGGPEMCELNEHIGHCESCRRLLEATAQASVQAVSMLADSRVLASDIVPPDGMRARFLSRAAAQGMNVADGPADVIAFDRIAPRKTLGIETSRVAVAFQSENRGGGSNVRSVQTARTALSQFGRVAAVLAGIAIVGIAGYISGHRRGVRASSQDVASASRPSASVAVTAGSSSAVAGTASSERIAELEKRRQDLEVQSRDLAAELASAKSEKKSLDDHLTNSMQQLSQLTEQTRADQKRASQERQDAKTTIASLQEEINRLRWELTSSEAKLSAQQKQSADLKAKLDDVEGDLQRELEARSIQPGIGNLVAERNLHIIDVYDVDKGKRQPSFGRVFYVEGKSLVFYVYDLEDPRRLTTNVVFHVWGEKSGMKETTHSLGILHNEDASQGCWTLTFDDPKILTQINSVFVTAEVPNKNFDEPRGKKLLYAYFGSKPNHP